MMKRNAKTTFDCIVIGGGPGGLVAAVYLKRLRRKVLLISDGPSRTSYIPKIRNLVGYSKGISGVALLERISEQYQSLNGDVFKGRARVMQKAGRFHVVTETESFTARKVIVATGIRDVDPPFENIKSLTKKGLVSYCPICDGFDHSKQRIGLLVSDATCVKKAKFMLGFSSNLVVVKTRRFRLSSETCLSLQKLKIDIAPGELTALSEAKGNRGLILKTSDSEVQVDSVYILLGSDVPDEAFRSFTNLKKDRSGYLMVDAHQRTSVKGLYAIGDCVKGLAQISVAVGQAAIAATDVHNSLD